MIDILRILFEFASVVVFCMLQFIIYPSLKFYSEENLKKWYNFGRDRIFLFALVIAPMHLVSTVFQLLNRQNAYTITSISVILLLWIMHYTIIEPKHRKIMFGIGSSEEHRHNISKHNFIRILLLLFLLCWTTYNTFKDLGLWSTIDG